jgi:hypothetical protein
MTDLEQTTHTEDIEETKSNSACGRGVVGGFAPADETITIEKVKQPRKKTEYVMTEARKLAFQRAQEKRSDNIKNRKLEKEQLLKDEKEIVKTQILEKANKIETKQKKEKKIITKYLSDSESDEDKDSDSSSDEEIIIVKKKNKKERETPKTIKQSRLDLKPINKTTLVNKMPVVDIFF